MIRTTLNWTVKNLKSMYDEKETLSFNHPIQRQSAQWDNEQQSLLIHSMLANFPVPAVYVHKTEVMNYSQYIKNNYPDECKDRLKRIIGFLNNVFYMKDKNLKKVNIPVLFLIADKALAESITGTNFRRWYNSFFEEHKKEYNLYCSSGSIKKEKTLGRIEIMTRYFDEYFRELNSQNVKESPSENDDTSSDVVSDKEISVPADGSDTVSAIEDTPVSDNTDNEVPTESETASVEEDSIGFYSTMADALRNITVAG